MKLALCLFIPALLHAQARGSWTTFGGDAQRSGWNKGETDLTPENIKGLKLEWSTKLDIRPMGLNGLTAPIVRANISTALGIKDYVVLGGVSDRLFVVDGDNGKLFWEKTLTIEGKPQRSGTWLCPNGLTATPVIGAALGGRGGQAVYAVASDGRLHGFSLLTGEEVLAPTAFVPPFAKAWSLNMSNNMANNVIYSTTSQGCNGVRSAVWSIDLDDRNHKTSSFSTSNGFGSGIWGRAGVAMTADGRIVFETGDGNFDFEKGLISDSVVELSKDLKLLDYYTPLNRTWITKKDLDMGNISPAIFPFKNRELVAAGGKEGVIYLLDAKNLGGADHRTPLYRSPRFNNDEVNFSGTGFWGAFSTWEDAAGTRWLLAPSWGPPSASVKFPIQYGPATNGSVMAFKVELKDDKPSLTPAWNSLDMNLPTPVVIANGMVFALADGDYGIQFDNYGNLLTVDERKAKTGHAILYALDAQTGKVLFSSGDIIKSFSHFSGFAVAGGRVYVGTYDGTLYAFGLGWQQ
jgi:hypothetical protein